MNPTKKLLFLTLVLICASVSALASPISSRLSLSAEASCVDALPEVGDTVTQGATISPLSLSVAATDTCVGGSASSFFMGSAIWSDDQHGVVKFHYGWDYETRNGSVTVGSESAWAFQYVFDTDGGEIRVDYDIVLNGQGNTGGIRISGRGPGYADIHAVSSGFQHLTGTFTQSAVVPTSWLVINPFSNLSGAIGPSGHLDVEGTFTFTVPGTASETPVAAPEPASLLLTCVGLFTLLGFMKAAKGQRLRGGGII